MVVNPLPHRDKLFGLRTERLGPLPILNHLLRRLRLEDSLDRHVPTSDPRCVLSHAKALGVLLRSIVVEREALYRQPGTAAAFAPAAFGLTEEERRLLDDDRIGRALDRLFRADRGALLTDVVVRLGKEFDVRLDRLHNDSTSVKFTGQYGEAKGPWAGGRRAPWITYGYSKDHRPDLKQLLFILTVSADGGVPVHFRCADGNTGDSSTHVDTWDTLRRLAGRPDFLYVADSKLCDRDTLDHIDKNRGRFVTVLPRTRMEDGEFRRWIQTHQPDWEKAGDRPNPRRKYGPRDRWWVFRAPLPSKEGWPVIWVFSSLLALHQEHSRRDQLAWILEQLGDLKESLEGPRSRLRKGSKIDKRLDDILRRFPAGRYLRVHKKRIEEHRFKQQRRGRPGPDASYRRITRRRWTVVWETNEALIAYDRKSDGMYPLLTNDRSLAPARVLEAHKGQPSIEKRFEQCKTVHEIAPVFLKNARRIEALFFLYFLALLVQALIERELRCALSREKIPELPLYPEGRACAHPTTEQILKLFDWTQRNVLVQDNSVVQVFDPDLSELQKEVLRLLGVPARAYRSEVL